MSPGFDEFEDEEDSFGCDRPGGLDEDREGCVLGERCCCPHPYHGADECFDAVWAERYFADIGERPTCCDQHQLADAPLNTPVQVPSKPAK